MTITKYTRSAVALKIDEKMEFERNIVKKTHSAI